MTDYKALAERSIREIAKKKRKRQYIIDQYKRESHSKSEKYLRHYKTGGNK